MGRRSFAQDKAVAGCAEKVGLQLHRGEPSGTFRDLIRELDLIVGRLRFRIVQLLPIFPTPTTYARMGMFGSPFAALDFMDVDPSLAEFDRCQTHLARFGELADAVHAAGAAICLQINHCGMIGDQEITGEQPAGPSALRVERREASITT